MKQALKGLAPMLVIFLIAVVAIGGYLVYTNYSSNRIRVSLERILTYKEVEEFIVNCQVYSVGQSHKDIDRGYLTIKLRDDTEVWFKVDKNYKSQIYQKSKEVTSSGKCPEVNHWIE